jgi:hypothetical protein
VAKFDYTIAPNSSIYVRYAKGIKTLWATQQTRGGRSFRAPQILLKRSETPKTGPSTGAGHQQQSWQMNLSSASASSRSAS